MAASDMITIVSLNLQCGGIRWADGSGQPDLKRLNKTLAALEELDRDSDDGIGWHVAALQEVTGTGLQPLPNPGWDMTLAERRQRINDEAERQHAAARQHLRLISGRTGSEGILGPPIPGEELRLYTAILVRKDAGVEVVGTGPPPAMEGNMEPAWCQASVAIDGVSHPVSVYSPHFPARSAARQIWQAQALVNHIQQTGDLAVVAGDINGSPRSDSHSEKTLQAMPPHLRAARMHLDDGPLRTDYSVDDALVKSGLVDVAVHLSGKGIAVDLGPTGKGGSRVDRHHATGETADAAVRYATFATGGDHLGILSGYDRRILAEAVPPGHRH